MLEFEEAPTRPREGGRTGTWLLSRRGAVRRSGQGVWSGLSGSRRAMPQPAACVFHLLNQAMASEKHLRRDPAAASSAPK